MADAIRLLCKRKAPKELAKVMHNQTKKLVYVMKDVGLLMGNTSNAQKYHLIDKSV